MEQINVNLLIADRTYPLKIKPEEEATIRQAAKEINEKIREFQGLYSGKDKQDYLAMAILVFAVESLRTTTPTEKQASAENISDKLEQLEKLLEQF